ncbi:trypsin-like serine peptidase [Staphylococcus simiae]|uniref:Serine protease n=1 Tax=Staphylococcus simiae CCM 7213 = CCUG 51256 TaxID=911238 RepID=G5JF72_9STAP|nr:serine protease [Staphylococcus simiae]EHJ09164.1 hypothetical protein SS7213T_00319 [Staphylococcus simiae CCM 7213 = CCUG 51256]PNZ13917.1 serine protease [Staphylococcus simiae]SNV58877.1 serine protease [Staphylococcus simiae]
MTTKQLIASAVTVMTMLMTANSAQAAENYYYDGMHSPNDAQALSKAKKISNHDVTISHYDYANKTPYKAVGRVSNNDGWKGYGKDSMGTGFVVGPHTFLTNGHVIDRKNGQPAAAKEITFDMNRDGKNIPYHFHATKVIKVPQHDIAIVYTKENLAKYVQPLKLASDSQISHLKFNDRLYSLGYPWQFDGKKDDNTKAYWNKYRVLQRSGNGTEIQIKDKFRSGASGSPMVNNKYQVFGLRTYGYNLRGNSSGEYAKQEVAGGEAVNGFAGKYIKERIK